MQAILIPQLNLVNNVRIGAKLGGSFVGAISIGFTIERLKNDGDYKLCGEGGLDLAFGVAGFIPTWGWAISGGYSVVKAVYKHN